MGKQERPGWRSMADIFISYRREDTRADAGRLYDRLSEHFGDNHVFMDIEDIAPGENFVEVLGATLADCDVLVALVGPRWVTSGNETDASRLDDPKDFVRLEVATALRRGIPVFPVLVGGSAMPRAHQLPDELSELVSRQALKIDDARFHQDVDTLIAALAGAGAKHAQGSRPKRWIWAVTLVVALTLVAAMVGFLRESSTTVQLRRAPAALSVEQVKVMLVDNGLYDAGWNNTGPGVANDFVNHSVGEHVLLIDKTTRLMWQKGGSPLQMAFSETTAYLQSLNEARHAGYDDWRLPTLEEAVSLLEPPTQTQRYADPIIDGPATPVIWTSDRGAGDGEARWLTWLADGTSRPERPSFHAWVKAVRSME